MPLGRDAVLGAGELVGQAGELRVRLQVRIVLGEREQPAERADETLVRGLDLLVARAARREHLRARVGDRFEDLLLVRARSPS